MSPENKHGRGAFPARDGAVFGIAGIRMSSGYSVPYVFCIDGPIGIRPSGAIGTGVTYSESESRHFFSGNNPSR